MSDNDQSHFDERLGRRVGDTYRQFQLDDAQRERHRQRLDQVISRENESRPGLQLGEIGAIAAVALLVVGIFVGWQILSNQPEDEDESALAPTETANATSTPALPEPTEDEAAATSTANPYQQEIEIAERRRESTIPYPPPESCAPATWFGPQQRVAEDVETPGWRFSYYLIGSGISLGSQSGVFFTGENDVRWMHAETAFAQDTRYSLTRLEPSPATGEITEHGESYTAPSHEDPDREFRIQNATLSFPEPGCWRIQAESDLSGLGLSVTVYVYPTADNPAVLREHDRLYTVEPNGKTRAVDLNSSAELFTIQGEGDTDIALSPTGDRLYKLDEDLAALDAITGEEIWSTPVEGRVAYIGGLGPSAINVSHRGDYLFVYSYTTEEPGHFWVQIFDADSGEKLRDTETFAAPSTSCPAERHTSTDDRLLYLICVNQGLHRVIDIETGEVLDEFMGPGVGSTISPDGRWIYNVTGSGSIQRVNTTDPENVESRRIEPPSDGSFTSQRLVAISPDGGRLYIGVGEDRRVDAFIVVDPDSGEIIDSFQIDREIDGPGLEVDSAGGLYAIDQPSIWRIDPATGDSQRILAGEEFEQLLVAKGRP